MTLSADQPFLDQWTDWLATDAPRRLAPATIGEYKRQVVAFARWMETTLAVSFTPESITLYRGEQYVATLEVRITRFVGDLPKHTPPPPPTSSSPPPPTPPQTLLRPAR